MIQLARLDSDTMPSSSLSLPLSLPWALGRYTLLRALGNETTTYLGADGNYGRLCIVHLLPPALIGRLDDARPLCQLSHPNLLQVTDADVIDGQALVATEFVAGRDLYGVLRKAAECGIEMPVGLSLYIAREIARGLSALHTWKGGLLTHGAVAPTNVILSFSGEVKLADFGLSRFSDADSSSPQAERRRYRGYLPPEQRTGGAPSRSRPGDVYSLGAVLYELLAGRLHFGLEREAGEAGREASSTPSEADADAPILPPSRFSSDLPPSLDALVLRALAADPEQRHSTAEELRQALGRELHRLAPDLDGSAVADFLRKLYGDQLIDEERTDADWMLEVAWRTQTQSRAKSGGRITGSPNLASGSPSEKLPPRSGRSLPSPGPELREAVTIPGASNTTAPQLRGDGSAQQRLIDGRYRLVRLLGLGGMGAVYEAQHAAIGKRVAVKILHPQFARHPELIERLRREAQAASRIGHPNIVDVLDFGHTEDGSPYLAMEFLDGTDLGAILRTVGRLPEARALRIAIQTARGLGAAHRTGIIHRDLKPENVFIVRPLDRPKEEPPATSAATPASEDDEAAKVEELVKILDFGIATQLAETAVPTSAGLRLPAAEATTDPTLSRGLFPRLTSPGLTVGTPEYMSPEQAMAQPVDARSDIYAVGNMLFEMLSGRLPFAAASVPELLQKKTSEAAPSLRSVEPSVSPELDAVVARCLLRDPAARPQSMEELARALVAVGHALGIPVDSLPGQPARLAAPGAAGAKSDPGDRSERTDRIEKTDRTEKLDRTDGSTVPMELIDLRPPRVATPVTTGSTEQVRAPASAPSLSASNSATRPLPRRSPVRTALGLLFGTAVVVGGFASARYFKGRRPPAPPVAATTPSLSSVRTEPAPSIEPTPRSVEPPRPVVPPPAVKEVPPPAPAAPPTRDAELQPLLEWAKRAAAGGRYAAPKGDNLVELLARIEALSPDNSDAKLLREQAAVTLSQRIRLDLRHRQPLPALASVRALRELESSPRYPHKELLFQLLYMARSSSKQKRDQALAAAQGAVDLAPSSAAAHLALADALLAVGKKDAATHAYKEVLSLRARPVERRLASQALSRLQGRTRP